MTDPVQLYNKKVISILGCGWFGLQLAKALIKDGHTVKGSSTTIEKLEVLSALQIKPFLINIQKNEGEYDAAFFQSDILFVCIPPKRKTTEQADFYHKIERIVTAAKANKIKQFIFISSTAVYGDTNSEVTELNLPVPETDSGKSMLRVEDLLKKQKAFTSTIIRFAGLVGPKRHPGRFFSDKKDIPNGKAPINLIHLNDCIGISLAIIRNEVFGLTFNACVPDHPAKQEFYIAAALNAKLTPPTFRDELLNWKIVSSVHTQLLNYNFLVTNWIDCCEEDNLC